MPNFRESDPSKIAVGFGGTLNLIVGLLFLLGILILMVTPWHLRAALVDSTSWLAMVTRIWLPLGTVLGFVIGGLVIWLPLRWGSRALERMEF